MFTNKMDKQILLYLYNKILFNNVEKNEVLIYTKMSLPVYIEWMKSTYWTISCIWISRIGKTNLGDSKREEGLSMGVENWLHYKGKWENFWDNRVVLYFDWGGDYRGVYNC